jgi:hypothetical protein
MEGGKRLDRLLIHPVFEDISSKMISREMILKELKTSQPKSDLNEAIDELISFQKITLDTFIDSIIKKPKPGPIEQIDYSMWDLIFGPITGKDKQLRKLMAIGFGKNEDWSEEDMIKTVKEFIPKIVEIQRDITLEKEKGIVELSKIIDGFREKIIISKGEDRLYYGIKYELYIKELFEQINTQIVKLALPIALYLFNLKYQKKR